MDTSTLQPPHAAVALEISMSREQTAETSSSASMNIMEVLDDSARASIGSSTPPTSLSSGPSDLADAPKEETPTEQRRSARARVSIGTYNLQVLAGTNIHTPTKYLKKNGATPAEPETPSMDESTSVDEKLLNSSLGDYWRLDTSRGPALKTESGEKSARRKSSRLDLVKEATTNAVAAATSATSKVLETGKGVIQSLTEARPRSQAEKSDKTPQTPSKRSRTISASATPTKSPSAAAPAAITKPIEAKKRRYYIDAGLYAGQVAKPQSYGAKKSRAKKVQQEMEIAEAQRKGSEWFPLPIFHGAKLMEAGRDFQLPRRVLNPLPRTEKPDGWMKISKNRAVDDAHEVYLGLCKRTGEQSACGCLKTCQLETCLNAVMNYECDNKNCDVGAENCNNRPFADLEARTLRGNLYDIGVEVVRTEDRGYGVRAMRAFKPNQIIMEYTGEIITQWECDRRMRKEYKNNECYYLMTFDRKLIIDATRGSMARFVNHSCEPNCEMCLWIVRGKPRMALFAKDNSIDAGDELTYDYNFEAFNESWSQQCRCGAAKCRGILGPRPKDVREPKIKELVSKAKKSLKRKAQAMLESGAASLGDGGVVKKRRVIKATRTKVTKTHAKVMAAAVASQVTSPKKAIQAANRKERAAARHSPGGRPKRVDASQDTSESPVKVRAGLAGALKRMKKAVSSTKTASSNRRAGPAYQRKRLATAREQKATSAGKKSQGSSGVASKAYAKKRSKISTKTAPSPRQSPRQKLITKYYKEALDYLLASDTEESDNESVSPDPDRIAGEVEDQIQNEMAASPIKAKARVPSKSKRAVGGKARAIPAKRKALGTSVRDARKMSTKVRR